MASQSVLCVWHSGLVASECALLQSQNFKTAFNTAELLNKEHALEGLVMLSVAVCCVPFRNARPTARHRHAHERDGRLDLAERARHS